MTDQILAGYSNLSIYSAMAVLTLALVAFAVDLAHLARKVPAGTAASRPLRTRGPGVTTLSRGLVTASARDRATFDSDVIGLRTPLVQDAGPGPGDAVGTPREPAATDVFRPQRPARRSAGVGMAFTWLGGGLAVAGVVLRGLSVSRVPWGNMYEFATTGAAAVLAAYLILSLRRDTRWLGIFVVGPSLLTLGLAVTVYYTQASQLLPALRSIWLIIHVSVAIASIAVFTLAFSVTILYLIQAHRESHTEPNSDSPTLAAPQTRMTSAPGQPSGERRPHGATAPANSTATSRDRLMGALPDALSLERTSYALHIVAFPLWTFTLIAGAIWAEQAWGAYWQWDPKEVWTFIIWVVYAAYLHARATSGWKRQRAALIACAGYACILINYMVVNVYFVGMHSYSGM